MDFILGARYGFHRQAYRRLSVERRLPRRLRAQPDRLDYARAVPRFVYEAGVNDAGRGLPVELPALPGEQCLQAGHRIRVDISSSNFPRFDVNPNSGGTLGEPGPIVVADNTIHHDAERPSHLVLPVVEE